MRVRFDRFLCVLVFKFVDYLEIKAHPLNYSYLNLQKKNVQTKAYPQNFMEINN